MLVCKSKSPNHVNTDNEANSQKHKIHIDIMGEVSELESNKGTFIGKFHQ